MSKHYVVDYFDKNQEKIMSSFGYLKEGEVLIEVVYNELDKIPPLIKNTITDIVIKDKLA